MATKNELALIQEARKRSLLVYGETTPFHLFSHSSSENNFLWEALNQGMIESIGSGFHVNQEVDERIIWHGENFEASNPIFFLPFLITAYHEKKITLETIARLTRVNLYDIFKLRRTEGDWVLIDLEKSESVQRVSGNKSNSLILKGWPQYTIVQNRLFKLPNGGDHLNLKRES